jgi:hypothetical protein
MSSKRKAPKGKKINPHFWVFCEGETEEAYIRHLRLEYRLPVEIIPKIAGCDISTRYIQSYKKDKPGHFLHVTLGGLSHDTIQKRSLSA